MAQLVCGGDVLWGSSSVGYGDPGMVMAVLSETVGVREAGADGG